MTEETLASILRSRGRKNSLHDINRAADALDGLEKLQAEVEQASEWRMDLRTQIARADKLATHWKAEADKLREENNSLRAQLLDALMDGERMRGYLDGTVDAEAPAMVPAQRERRLDRYTGTPRAEPGYSDGYAAHSYDRQAQKRWFQR